GRGHGGGAHRKAEGPAQEVAHEPPAHDAEGHAHGESRGQPRVVLDEIRRGHAAQDGGDEEDGAHGAGEALAWGSDSRSSAARWSCQIAGQEWVPWPRVRSEMGSSTARPRGTRRISRS